MRQSLKTKNKKNKNQKNRIFRPFQRKTVNQDNLQRKPKTKVISKSNFMLNFIWDGSESYFSPPVKGKANIHWCFFLCCQPTPVKTIQVFFGFLDVGLFPIHLFYSSGALCCFATAGERSVKLWAKSGSQ